MEHEASEAGLRFAEREAVGEWTWDRLRKDGPTKSLHDLWWIPEYLPIKWPAYSGKEISTTRYSNFLVDYRRVAKLTHV